jgi:hypothetical protein
MFSDLSNLQILSQDRRQLIESAIVVLNNLSRTINGEGNTDVSTLKHKPLIAGQQLIDQVSVNFTNAVELLIINLVKGLRSPDQTRDLIISAANHINSGIISNQQGFFRQWSGYPIQVPPESVESEFEAFCLNLYERQDQIFDSPKKFAADCEYEFNIRIHPLADGCGRSSIALATAILACTKLEYPKFESRTEYFRNALISKEHWLEYYEHKSRI